MTKIEVEVFDDAINSPIVRMPGRKFPGVVVQGDSLHMLWTYARDISKDVAGSAGSDAKELLDRLSELIAVYERALKAHGMRLPYNKLEH